jgi:phage baseplate assembly protein W
MSIKRTDVYSDIDMSMGLTIRSDIAKVFDVNAIKQSVKNIVMTRDRLFHPESGPRISNALFDMDNPFNRALIKDEIILALKKNEKRVTNVDVDFGVSRIDSNELECNITFSIVNTIGRYEVSVVLQRVR